MPRDAAATDSVAGVLPAEVAYLCARCRRLVTRGRWRLAMGGSHEHVVFNPAGIVFRVLCFKEAPGAVAAGEASADFSWFGGYSWRLALCAGCGAHLGWRYEGDGPPAIFFGLIKPMLVEAAEK